MEKRDAKGRSRAMKRIYLGRYSQIAREIRGKTEEFRRIESLAFSVAPILNQTGPVSGGGTPESKTERNVLAMEDLRADISKNLEQLFRVRVEIIDAIEQIESESSRNILKMRYMSEMTYEQIADAINRTPRNVRYMINKALDSFTIPK